MVETRRAEKLYELEKAARDLNDAIENLNMIKEKIIEFAYALEKDPLSIVFVDRDPSVPMGNQFEFNYEELNQIINLKEIDEMIIHIKKLSEKKTQLEEELGVHLSID
jgi:hypothetical protein